MANLPIISFNSGKLTPKIDTRSDTEKYGAGCRECQNMIPLIYGPAERRPGTKLVATVDTAGVVSKMIPFVFSSAVSYELEFGDLIINVYFDGTFITSVVTPFLEADLFSLQFDQLADVMWLTHNSYNPYKLTRTNATTFSLDKIPFTDGPFIERNDIAEDDDVTIGVTGYTIATVVNGSKDTAAITIESATDISGLFTANKRFYITGATADTIDAPYTVHDTTATTYVGTTVTILTNETITSDPLANGQVMVDDGVVTLTASSAEFTTGASGHIDSLWKLTHKRARTATKGTATATGIIGEAIDVKGTWTFTTSGNWGATVEVQRLADGTNWETFRTYVSLISGGQGSFNAQKSDVEEENGVQYRIFVTEYTGGTVEATFLVDESTQDSIFKITAVASTTSATATALVAAPDNVATKRWAEGSWSFVRGWPKSITFFDERAVYGFTNNDNRTVWLSEVGDTEDFEAGVNDSDSFAVTLPTTNQGKWLGSLEALAAGTSGGEWRIRSTSFDQALTPTNFSIKQQTDFGSADIQAMNAGDAIIFVDSVARKIREYTWSEQKAKYLSPDLTALAEDIAAGGITSMAVQRHPDSILWFTIANSPYLISMTYEREQNVVAFAEHPVGGSGITESVCVTHGSAEDKITLTVKRTINSATVRTIETMQPRDWGADTQIFFVDAGIIDTSGTTTITGLSHLEGEVVQVVVDGAKQADKTVASGQITIDAAGTRVVTGLSYEYKLEPMRADISTSQGTTLGSIMKTSEIVVSFLDTLNAKFGDGTDQYDIGWRTTEVFGSPPALFTGDKTLSFDGGFTSDTKVQISGSDPFPCTVRAIILRSDKVGR